MKLKDCSLKIKLGFIFMMFFLLYIVSFLVQSYYMNDQKNIGKLINVAGQQRMVLQKMVKDTLMVSNGSEFHKKELVQSGIQYEQNLQWLIQENHAPLVAKELVNLLPRWEEYQSYIHTIETVKDSRVIQTATTSLLKYSNSILNETNHLVTLLENYSQESTERLQWISQFILISNFAVVIIAYWISSKEIIQPITEVFHNINRIAAGHLQMKSMLVDRKDEIGHLKTSFNRMLYSLKQIQQTGMMQEAFLPSDMSSEKFEVRTVYQASDFVSGDFYNYIWDPKKNILKGYLFDIMGHGLITAIQTSSLRVLFEQALHKGGTPSEKMAWVNREAVKYFTEDTFAAAFYFEFDFDLCQLIVSSGGINQYITVQQGQVSLRKVEGGFIGLTEEMEYEDYREVFGPQDSFIFMSDGVSDQLPSWISDKPSDLSTIYQGIVQMTRTQKNHDDMSVVFFEVK